MAGKAAQISATAEQIATVAELCHEINRRFCQSIGDDSQPEWSKAPDWQVASALAGVEFHLANPDASEAASHENWMKAKKADGWKHGAEKDPDKKLHPCMVPFKDLPPEQQFKDALFRHTVHSSFALLELTALTALEAENAELKRKLAAQKGQTTRARNEKEAAIASFKPRPIGPLVVEGSDEAEGDGLLSPAEMLELAEAAGRIEIAFSDGKDEVSLPVVLEDAGQLQLRRGRLGLNVGRVRSVLVHGPEQGQPSRRIAGYALLLDGEQVAWAERYEPLLVGAGQTMEMRDDVLF